MWTRTTRRQHSRDGLRYGTALTHVEWLWSSPTCLNRPTVVDRASGRSVRR